MLDTVLVLLLLGAANHQMTHVITAGVLFQDFRQFVKRRVGGKLAYIVTCYLCLGTQIGLIQGVAFGSFVTVVSHPVLNALVIAFATAMLGRVWNELLALAAALVTTVQLYNAQREQDAEDRAQEDYDAETDGWQYYHSTLQGHHWVEGVPAADAPSLGDVVPVGAYAYRVSWVAERDGQVSYQLYPLIYDTREPDPDVDAENERLHAGIREMVAKRIGNWPRKQLVNGLAPTA